MLGSCCSTKSESNVQRPELEDIARVQMSRRSLIEIEMDMQILRAFTYPVPHLHPTSEKGGDTSYVTLFLLLEGLELRQNLNPLLDTPPPSIVLEELSHNQ